MLNRINDKKRKIKMEFENGTQLGSEGVFSLCYVYKATSVNMVVNCEPFKPLAALHLLLLHCLLSSSSFYFS